MNNIIVYNVVDALILSILDTDMRMINYEKKIVSIDTQASSKNKKIHKYDKTKLRVIFKFNLKMYGLYSEKRRRPDKSSIIKNISNIIHNKLKVDILTIRFNKNLMLLDLKGNTNYDICINIILDISTKLNKNNRRHIIPLNGLISPFSSTSELNDIAIGSKVKLLYPKVYNVLSGTPGYMWNHYYTSIMRMSWFNLYFLMPNTYVECVPALLEYFAGMDEICLFDIVCKFHVNKLDKTKYKSYMDMRYKLKKIFIDKIINFDLLKFSKTWRLHPYEVYRFNNVKYAQLEYNFGGDQINVTTFIGFIYNNNIDAAIYIIDKIDPDILYKNLRNIRNHILISNINDNSIILQKLYKFESSYLNMVDKLPNNLISEQLNESYESSESSESISVEIIYM